MTQSFTVKTRIPSFPRGSVTFTATRHVSPFVVRCCDRAWRDARQFCRSERAGRKGRKPLAGPGGSGSFHPLSSILHHLRLAGRAGVERADAAELAGQQEIVVRRML